MRPVDFKDKFYDRKPLSSNNDLYGVLISCADKKEKPKASSNRISNNTSPVADSKKA